MGKNTSSSSKQPQQGGGKKAVPTNEAKETAGKPKSNSKSDKSKNTKNETVIEEPKKPTVRSVIGGASWTGKLPVNLLSEHCQKQKWQPPQYDIDTSKPGYVMRVTLAQKDLKSGTITTLPPIQLPRSVWPNVAEPTTLEARHLAAAFGLFRVSSMKNVHMTMPPKYKDIWKGLFSDLKKEDVKNGLAWKYEADPFLTARNREQEEIARQKKKEEEERLKAKQTDSQGPSLVKGPKSAAWERAPKVDMGRKMRLEVESVIRLQGSWNIHGHSMSDEAKKSVITSVSKLGFRPVHVQEAAEICKDSEEVLEWLLTHVPEDDLPKWSLPENYVAGVSMANSDLKKEAILKRLASAGYGVDLCEDLLNQHGGDERDTAFALQSALLDKPLEKVVQDNSKGIETDHNDAWLEEQEIVSSIYGDKYHHISNDVVQVQLETDSLSPKVTIQFRRPLSGYPQVLPILTVHGQLPAYIRLSITKKALENAISLFLGEAMIYNMMDWLEQNILKIIDRPGRLSLVSGALAARGSSLLSKRSLPNKKCIQRSSKIPSSVDGQKILTEWKSKHTKPVMIKMLSQRQGLPAWTSKDLIVDAVQKNKVTIISGETGSGKSTQSVQFILDDLIQKGLGARTNIICTQPRRISAIGLAERVAEERAGLIGEEIGYIIRGDSKVKAGQTRITFVTTGVLLRRLQTSGGTEDDLLEALLDISHVVIDEVHERNVDTDFLLILLKMALKKRSDLKVILMSATTDANAFEEYFKEIGNVGRIHISGRTFPVDDFFKDDIIRMTGHLLKPSNEFTEDYSALSDKAISTALRSTGMGIDYELISKTVDYIDRSLGEKDGSILIFLPGAMEIDKTIRHLSYNSNLFPLPLHASLPPAEQRRVFSPPPKKLRKVIAATNVAETSITISDIVAVIDSGRVKQTFYDPLTSTQRLVEMWTSKASITQRKGRAGRVRKGQCYKMYTRSLEDSLSQRPDPEILRVPLEQLCLAVRGMGIIEISDFLRNAPTPPSSEAIDVAITKLRVIGALDPNGDLTALGKHLAMIPADLKAAKLLVLGCTFGCIDACLTMAAILSSRSPFFSPRDKQNEAKEARYQFAPGNGDLIADMMAYDEWIMKRSTSGNAATNSWMNLNFLSFQSLRDIESNRAQLLSALKDQQFLPLSYPSSPMAQSNFASEFNHNVTSIPLLRALLSSAFHPSILTITYPPTKFAASHTGSVALDPEARTIKFFDPYNSDSNTNSRIFIHPSSTCFEAGRGWAGTPSFVSVHERTETNGKKWARGVTPVGTYGVLLLGGGRVSVDQMGRGIMIDDGEIRVRGWARIGVLVSRMRELVESVLEKRVEDPLSRFGANEMKIVEVVRKLVEKEGLDR